jgi:hypothetical protein
MTESLGIHPLSAAYAPDRGVAALTVDEHEAKGAVDGPRAVGGGVGVGSSRPVDGAELKAERVGLPSSLEVAVKHLVIGIQKNAAPESAELIENDGAPAASKFQATMSACATVPELMSAAQTGPSMPCYSPGARCTLNSPIFLPSVLRG